MIVFIVHASHRTQPGKYPEVSTFMTLPRHLSQSAEEESNASEAIESLLLLGRSEVVGPQLGQPIKHEVSSS